MGDDQQYVSFGIDCEIFAVSVDFVQEILDLRPIARLPHAPDYMLGIMDVRGAGMPVVDLRVKLGFAAKEPTSRTRVIIFDGARTGHQAVGLVTDCVFEVTDLGGADLKPPPTVSGTWRSDCVVGIARRGESFVMALDLTKLLAEGEPTHPVTTAA